MIDYEKVKKEGVVFEVREKELHTCVEIRHPSSKYSDRVVIKTSTDQKNRIENLKEALYLSFRMAVSSGEHFYQRYKTSYDQSCSD